MTKASWSVYCMDTDEPIGIWVKYEDAYEFWLDHVEVKGCNYALFPYEETLFSVKA